MAARKSSYDTKENERGGGMTMTNPAPHLEPNRADMGRKLTKQRRKEICREIIDRCPIGVEMPADDLAQFNAMCGTAWPAGLLGYTTC